MWIESPRFGGFSIVLADDLKTGRTDPTRVMVRARFVEHLVRLRDAHPGIWDCELFRSEPGTDYPFRMIVPKSKFASVLALMLMHVDYRDDLLELSRNRAALVPDFTLGVMRGQQALRALQPVWRGGETLPTRHPDFDPLHQDTWPADLAFPTTPDTN